MRAWECKAKPAQKKLARCDLESLPMLGCLAPRARFELAALRLIAEAVKTSKCHIWRRLRDLKAIYPALELDGNWTEVDLLTLRSETSPNLPSRYFKEMFLADYEISEDLGPFHSALLK